MLAPFKDRAGLEQALPDAVADGGPPGQVDDCRSAKRESRIRVRRDALENIQQVVTLHAEVCRLQALCDTYRSRVERYESGVALIELGQELMRLSENNERLKGAVHRARSLEMNLEAALKDCERLAAERDALAGELRQSRQECLGG